MSPNSRPSVGIVGGGLAGLSAAAWLAEKGYRVELFEAKRRLGGRAGSFVDPVTQGLVDNCQHVSMGCCSAFASFCRRTGIAEFFQRFDRLHFIDSAGQQFDFSGTQWLPAPLHLAPAFLRLGFLTMRERWQVALGLAQLKLLAPTVDSPHLPNIRDWLLRHHQTPELIEKFWGVVLVSALGETLERASVPVARKVFVDGFMNSRDGYCIFVPTIPLGRLYDQIATALRDRGVALHLETPVAEVLVSEQRQVRGLRLGDGSERPFDFVIVAVPWLRFASLLSREAAQLAGLQLDGISSIESSPITSVHLWFDRPLTPLPHAVIVNSDPATKPPLAATSKLAEMASETGPRGLISQWMFNRGEQRISGEDGPMWHYYQVVISASRALASFSRDEISQRVIAELCQLWPAGRGANVGHVRVITEHDAVFSVRPGLDRQRPPAETRLTNLMLAGDWTQTGWPATMESAVRSGEHAALSVFRTRR